MNNYFKFGIDLGTTNSSIATFTSEGVHIFKNGESMDVTPSAVYIKNNRTYVGSKALGKIEMDPLNGAKSFKREMGLTTKRNFDFDSVTKTPVELSALVLKSLADDVLRLNGEIVQDVIITVPAAFGTLQCDSTYEAAKLANFRNVFLLQEPIAAAISYGLNKDTSNQYWIVYDFGGGTFDVAIVSTFDERLTILQHEGDNYLGGKDIDEEIFKKLVLPKLMESDYYEGDTQNFTMKQKVSILSIIEQCKKDLSTADNVRVIFDEDLELYDYYGELIVLDFNISRSEFNSIISDIVEKTLILTDKAISDSKIPKEKFSKIILVGGTTFIPMIREKISARYRIPLEYSVDPMTVVSRGAAIFGSTKKIDFQVMEDFDHENDVSINFEYDSLTPDKSVEVIGRLFGQIEEITEYKIDHESGFWSSGWRLIEIGGFIDLEIKLLANRLNTFNVILRNRAGLSVIPKNSIIEVKQNDLALIPSQPPIPMSLCIEVVDNNDSELFPLIKKGMSLPAKGIRTFRAASDIIAGTDSFLAIKIWEGETFEFPELNNWVTLLKIDGNKIKKSITKGQKIIVSMKLDESRKINVTASIPEVDLHLSKEDVFSPELFDVKEHLSTALKETQEMYQEILSNDDDDTIMSFLSEEALETSNHIEQLMCEESNDDLSMKAFQDYKNIKKKYLLRKKEMSKENFIEKEDKKVRDLKQLVLDFGDSESIKTFEMLEKEYALSSSVEQKKFVSSKMDEITSNIIFNNFEFLSYYALTMLEKHLSFKDYSKVNQIRENIYDSIDRKSMIDLKAALREFLDNVTYNLSEPISDKHLPPGLWY